MSRILLPRRAVLPLLMAAPFLPRLARAEGLRDALGRPVVALPARRIICLGPDLTEIVASLGAGDRIVARDRASTYPPGMDSRINLGARRQLSAEGVLSVEADLILAADDIGPPEVLEVLKAQSIPFVTVPRDFSVQGIVTKIEIIAATLDLVPEGARLAEEVRADYHAAEAVAADIPEGERIRAVFLHGLLRLSAAGRNTAAGEMLRAAGAQNVFADHDGYLSASPEMMLARDPQIVVMMPAATGGPTVDQVFAETAFSGTTAAQNRALMVLDDNLMIGFGPRTAGQIRRLAGRLYPDRAG